MNDLRDSKDQLRDEMLVMYNDMTDPYAIAERQRRSQVEQRISHKKKRYGL